MQYPSLFWRTLGLIVCLGISTFLVGTQTGLLFGSAPSSAALKRKTDPKGEKEPLLSNTRQMTFAGRRSGEGYFSQDGTQFVFQSEREESNPFFQIYLMDLEKGRVLRVSPGHGKTTCAWIHPDGKRLLFSSSHEDPEARDKQKQELERRASGAAKRYTWDFDKHHDIFVGDLRGADLRNVTQTLGYDAEASWSPDGSQIVFSSNRLAYAGGLNQTEIKARDQDPSRFVDLYLMRGDGSEVRRITTTPGYDGGPFFSQDGKLICWRRFSEDGSTAEIFVRDVEGTWERQLTHLQNMSWAPFFHPSGDYLIFTTNVHGFDNFELYIVGTDGGSKPIRVTATKGFDGLPVFPPDGKRLSWTTNRTPGKTSQIFMADWDDTAARRLLGLTSAIGESSESSSPSNQIQEASGEIRTLDLRRHIEYLASEKLEGRMTGSVGERLATDYAASVFETLKLEPGGEGKSFFQTFPFTAGVSLGSQNRLELVRSSGKERFAADQDWRPLAYSKVGSFGPAGVTVAGYGIVAPEGQDASVYDSFAHLDVKGKWVLVFRYLPDSAPDELRSRLTRYASLRYKAIVAADRGAQGLIVVSGPNAGVREELVGLSLAGSLSAGSIPVISITNRVASILLENSGRSLKALQDSLDSGDLQSGFSLQNLELKVSIDLESEDRSGRNVLGLLRAGRGFSSGTLVIGAHIDHLGTGLTSSSLARAEEKGGIHYGADDNASGVAAVLEIAEHLVSLRRQGRLNQTRDVLFALWSGEELGLLGSGFYTRNLSSPGSESDSLRPRLAAYLNLDMVGRLKESLFIQGVGSSSIWTQVIESSNLGVDLSIVTQQQSHLPTDATSFYVKGVPILSAFTGGHEDYHTPRDQPSGINYSGCAKIARLIDSIAQSLMASQEAPDYLEMQSPKNRPGRSSLRSYLGTIPDYGKADEAGVSLSGVVKEGPAQRAGLKGGDLVIELGGREIANIYDYTYAIDFLKPGVEVKIVVQREGKRISLQITPESRD